MSRCKLPGDGNPPSCQPNTRGNNRQQEGLSLASGAVKKEPDTLRVQGKQNAPKMIGGENSENSNPYPHPSWGTRLLGLPDSLFMPAHENNLWIMKHNRYQDSPDTSVHWVESETIEGRPYWRWKADPAYYDHWWHPFRLDDKGNIWIRNPREEVRTSAVTALDKNPVFKDSLRSFSLGSLDTVYHDMLLLDFDAPNSFRIMAAVTLCRHRFPSLQQLPSAPNHWPGHSIPSISDSSGVSTIGQFAKILII